MRSKRTIILFALFSLMHNFVKAKNADMSHPKRRNEITGAFGGRKVCMNVCNPPYYSQEYPQTNGGQYNPAGWNQNYLPGGFEGPGPGDYNQNLLPGYESLEGNQFYPQGDFGDYVAGCYRNMFRKRYRMDPGKLKPSIYNYKTLSKRIHGLRRNRNYNQDFMNCQLICYPVMVPGYVPSSTLTTTEPNETTEEIASTTKKQTQKPTSKRGKKIKRHKKI